MRLWTDIWSKQIGGGEITVYDGVTIKAAIFGARPSASARTNTDAIQRAIDLAESLGGGTVELAYGHFNITRSALTETWATSKLASDICCLALRPRVVLKGQGRMRTVLVRDEDNDAHYSMIVVLSANGSGIRDLSLNGIFVNETLTPGAGHGIITQPLSDNVGDWICHDLTIQNVGISNVASYGIGIEHGDMQRILIEEIWIYNTGADGIDTKDSADDVGAPITHWPVVQCKMRNLHLQKWAQRLGGGNPACIDINGPWMVEDVWAIDESRVDVPTRGIRTDGAQAGGHSIGGERCHIHNFHVTYRGACAGFPCLSIRVPGVVVSGGTCEGGDFGIQFSGNADGQPEYANVSNVTCIDQLVTAVNQLGTGVLNISMSQVIAKNAPEGFYVEGQNVTLMNCFAIGCATELTIASTARSTIQLLGNRLGNNAHRLPGRLAVGQFDNFDDPGSAAARVLIGSNIAGSSSVPNGELLLGHPFDSVVGTILGKLSFYCSDETLPDAKGVQASIKAVGSEPTGRTADLTFSVGTGAQGGDTERLRLTTNGLKFPQYTTAERDALVGPVENLYIHNLTTKRLEFHNGTAWGPV